ncbi:hypothetical protein GCM10017744_104190 [Streptomyces antimycoticus]|uniref:Uncharacterized protein n=1 Tax=Streptomyces antimycoticus TaxID=68175 RepID=A0A4D4KKW4_9ACTN|nr:hypothetical protein SANT12839_100240 [Streptomyces antimycoticus]
MVVPKPAEHPYSHTKVIDMTQGTRTQSQTHSTPPWGQRRMRERWPVGGVFAFDPTPAPKRPSVEGVGMR